jgi:predicted NAD/FAD-binding protein
MSSTTNPVASTNGNNADAATKKRVAIVGSGVAGLAAAWALNEYSPHDVVLYEAADYVGGHTHTVTFKKGDKETPVDSGFIVANTATYPNFLAFLKHQGIQLNETEMSFSVSRDAGAFEWSGSGLSALFAQSANIVNKDIYRMVYDVLRFNQYSTDILSATRGRQDQQLTIGQYLDKYGYSESFKNNYLIVRHF